MSAINLVTRTEINEFLANPSLDNYQRLATRSAIYPGQGTALGLAYVALKGAGEAGEFAEHVGKAFRDDNYGQGLQVHLDQSVSREIIPLTAARRELLIKEVGDQLWYLAAKCNELEISFSHVAAENLEKLADRSARGTLQGSGDER